MYQLLEWEKMHLFDLNFNQNVPTLTCVALSVDLVQVLMEGWCQVKSQGLKQHHII